MDSNTADNWTWRSSATAASSALLLAALLLTGCGATGGGDANDDGASKPAADAGGEPANWQASDACTILDKAALAAALKQDIPDATLALVHQAGAAEAATSECSYIGADGAPVASLQARWSPIADGTDETIAAAHAATAASVKAFTDKPVEEIAGLGKAAYFVPGINQLHVYYDASRSIVLSLPRLPEGVNGKDVAVELARQAGG